MKYSAILWLGGYGRRSSIIHLCWEFIQSVDFLWCQKYNVNDIALQSYVEHSVRQSNKLRATF